MPRRPVDELERLESLEDAQDIEDAQGQGLDETQAVMVGAPMHLFTVFVALSAYLRGLH